MKRVWLGDPFEALALAMAGVGAAAMFRAGVEILQRAYEQRYGSEHLRPPEREVIAAERAFRRECEQLWASVVRPAVEYLDTRCMLGCGLAFEPGDLAPKPTGVDLGNGQHITIAEPTVGPGLIELSVMGHRVAIRLDRHTPAEDVVERISRALDELPGVGAIVSATSVPDSGANSARHALGAHEPDGDDGE